MFADAYRGKRVLVTGHTGFKGSWLCLWLAQLGATVDGYALGPNGSPNLFSLARLANDVRHVLGDIRDFDRLAAWFKQTRPEVVFHLAAQPLVRRSYRDPKYTFDVNVGGTVNVLEAVRQTPSVRAAVIVTSDKCYENREWVYAYRENDPMGGYDPYSASKGAAELVIAAYRKSYFNSEPTPRVGIASARAGNVIGGGDFSEDRILADAVRAMLAEEALDVRSPHAVRPWQHVLDALGGYLLLGSRLLTSPRLYADSFNFGPPQEQCVTVEQLVDRFYRALGAGQQRSGVRAEDAALHEAGRLVLSCEKASSLLGWRPVISIDRALEISARWYRSVLLEGADAASACRSDLEYYVRAAREASVG